MANVKILAGRIASLSYKFAKDNDIIVFPVNIIMGDKSIKDDNDENATKFLKKLPELDEIPSTSIPSHGEMLKIFREATADVRDAIYVAASTKLSGICDRGKQVAKDLAGMGRNIHVFDSEGAISFQGMYAYVAAKMAKQGKSVNEILSHLTNIQSNRKVVVYGVINTLKYLEKNGRIGKAKAWLANLFSFKPIISVKDGEIEPVAKARTDGQALQIVVDKMKEDIERTKTKKVSVMYDYGLSDDYIKKEVQPRLQKEFDVKLISSNQISTAIACHLGPEVWGVTAYYE